MPNTHSLLAQRACRVWAGDGRKAARNQADFAGQDSTVIVAVCKVAGYNKHSSLSRKPVLQSHALMKSAVILVAATRAAIST